MPETAAALNKKFGIAGAAEVIESQGGLPAVRITTSLCSGEVYLLGGQVTRWKPAGSDEVLWISRHSNYAIGKAIRGGVPVCFPWFGAKADDPKAPSHGFVRTREWQLESITRADNAVTVFLLTRSDEATKSSWPADFELRLRAAFGSELHVALEFTNVGSQPARFEEALHAYFNVADVRQSAVKGLDAIDYLDKTDSNQRKTQSGDIPISSETDRVYLRTSDAIEILSPALHRRILIRKTNSLNTVVWNPWIEKARSLSDFGDDEWPYMLCVEPSNVGASSVEVAPGQQHSMAFAVSTSAL